MELKDVVAIAGQSGLHKIVGRTKNGLIVETIGSGRRFATNFQDKVSVLEDISIFTADEDMRLNKALLKLKSSAEVPTMKEDIKAIRKYLIDTIQLDSERVYDNDIKKLINWFHLLKDVLDFSKLEESIGAESSDENAESVSENSENATETHPDESKGKRILTQKAPTPKSAAPKNVATKANTKGSGGPNTTYRSKTV